MGSPGSVVERRRLALQLEITGQPRGATGSSAEGRDATVPVPGSGYGQSAFDPSAPDWRCKNWSPMPSKQVVSDEALSAALGMYAGMVGQVLNNPRRWLGVDEDPPLTAGPPGSSMLSVTALSATSHPPRRTGRRPPGPSSIYRTCSTNAPAVASSPARWPSCPSSASPAGGSTNAEPSARQPNKPND